MSSGEVLKLVVGHVLLGDWPKPSYKISVKLVPLGHLIVISSYVRILFWIQLVYVSPKFPKVK